MAELTDKIIGVIRQKVEDIEFGQIILSFHGKDYVQISVKKDERIYPDRKGRNNLKSEIRNG